MVLSRPLLALSALALALALPACGEPSATEESASQTGDGRDESESRGESESESDTGEESCPSDTPAQLAACVERDAYLADLEFIAQTREPGSAHWQAVQDLCAERFAAYGFEVELHSYATGVNVVGRLPGTDAPDEQIVVAAHYDHIPGCNGADDNASGTAATLEAARVLSLRSYPRTLVVACWDEEESGLIGAEAFANEAAAGGETIVFNYNFEMIGYYDEAEGAQTVPEGIDLLFPVEYGQLMEWGFTGDWIALIVDQNGAEHAGYMAAHADAIGLEHLVLEGPDDLKNSALLADLRRSDHAAFWAVDIPAMMITDTSEFRYAAYHCQSGEDEVELLDHDFATQVISASVGAAAQSLGLPEGGARSPCAAA